MRNEKRNIKKPTIYVYIIIYICIKIRNYTTRKYCRLSLIKQTYDGYINYSRRSDKKPSAAHRRENKYSDSSLQRGGEKNERSQSLNLNNGTTTFNIERHLTELTDYSIPPSFDGRAPIMIFVYFAFRSRFRLSAMEPN